MTRRSYSDRCPGHKHACTQAKWSIRTHNTHSVDYARQTHEPARSDGRTGPPSAPECTCDISDSCRSPVVTHIQQAKKVPQGHRATQHGKTKHYLCPSCCEEARTRKQSTAYQHESGWASFVGPRYRHHVPEKCMRWLPPPIFPPAREPRRRHHLTPRKTQHSSRWSLRNDQIDADIRMPTPKPLSQPTP